VYNPAQSDSDQEVKFEEKQQEFAQPPKKKFKRKSLKTPPPTFTEYGQWL
jgi:hypothetical protein